MTALHGDQSAVAEINPDEFRDVLGRFASGLVIVAANTESGPVGFTCQSFFSLSLDPPLVAISVRRGSTTWAQIEPAGYLTVSVLADGQHDLARKFGRAAVDKFEGVRWTNGPNGPRIVDALANLDCRIECVTNAGDHHIVIARVTELNGRHGQPLLFYRGSFGGFHHTT